VCCLACGGAISAAAAPGINDEAGFFSAEAVEKATQAVQKINADYPKTNVLIETVSTIPAELQGKVKELGAGKFFPYWATQRIADAKFSGVYILLCRRPGQLQVEVDKQTRQKAFTQADVDQLVKVISAQLREKKYDAALLEGVDCVQSALQKNLGKPKAAAKKKR
jgi:HEPN domain-containing protein